MDGTHPLLRSAEGARLQLRVYPDWLGAARHLGDALRVTSAGVLEGGRRPDVPALLGDEFDVVDAQLDGAGAPVRVDLPLQPDDLARRGDR